MVNYWENRDKRNKKAKSKAHNFGKILHMAKLTNSNEPIKEWHAKSFLEKLVKTNKPKRGDLIAFEEMNSFLGSPTLFYLGIITDPKEMLILSQEFGKTTIEGKQHLINEYVIPYLETAGYKISFYRREINSHNF